jgi:hypothetical protein
MSMHPARQAYVEEETRGDAMEGIDYASVRTSFSINHLPLRPLTLPRSTRPQPCHARRRKRNGLGPAR